MPKELSDRNVVLIVEFNHFIDAVVLEPIAPAVLPALLTTFRVVVFNVIVESHITVVPTRSQTAPMSLVKWLVMVNAASILPP
jgi:hypothetical protein